MFKSLDIANFQSHALSHLDFVDGVNLIIGKSDSGKSAILRSINWVVNNRPLGDGILRDGATDATVVQIETDKGIVGKYKWKKQNSYLFNDKVYEAFGSSVPQEIVDFFNLSDINIQNQLSPYFLILDSSGQIGTYLREVCKLDKLDDLYSDLSKKINKVESDIEQYDMQMGLIDQNPIYSDSFLSELDKLESLITLYEDVNKLKTESFKSIFELSSILDSISKIKLVAIPEEVDLSLSVLFETCTYLQSNLDSTATLGSIIRVLEGLRAITIPEGIYGHLELFDGLAGVLRELEDSNLNLIDLIKHITNDDVRYLSNKEGIVELEKKQSAIYTNLKACPYCESELSEMAKGKLLENVR